MKGVISVPQIHKSERPFFFCAGGRRDGMDDRNEEALDVDPIKDDAGMKPFSFLPSKRHIPGRAPAGNVHAAMRRTG